MIRFFYLPFLYKFSRYEKWQKKTGQRPAFFKSNKNYLDAAAEAAAGAASAAGDAGAAAASAAGADAGAASAGADAGAAGADAGAASTAGVDAGVSAGLLHATKATANIETSKSDFFMFLLSKK